MHRSPTVHPPAATNSDTPVTDPRPESDHTLDESDEPQIDRRDPLLYVPRCPQCATPMVGIASTGLDTHISGPCGCRVVDD